MNYLLILIILLSIPFVSAQSIMGSDGIESFAASTDVVTITVALHAPANPPSEILKQRVTVTSPLFGLLRPDTCMALSSDTYSCTLRERISGQQGTLMYTARTTNADGTTLSTHELPITIDNDAPVILDADIHPRTSANNTFTALVRATDAPECAGINHITILAGDTELTQRIIDPHTCLVDTTLPFTLPSPGEHTLCIEITDNFEHTTQECLTATYDITGPTLVHAGLATRDGTYYTHLNHERDLYLAATLYDPSTVARVEAATENGEFHLPTVQQNGTYYFETIRAQPGAPCTLRIRATDALGNTATYNASCAVAPDTTAPQLIRINTTASDADGNAILGSRGTLTAHIIENGAGLLAQDIILDLTPLGLARAPANECTRATDRWICTWQNITPVRDAEHVIPITLLDTLGNTATDEDILIVNTDAPLITSVTQSPSFASAATTLQYIVTVNSQYDVTIDSPSALDFARIGGKDCQIQTASGEWVCVLTLTNLPNDYRETTIDLDIVDELGMRTRVTRPLTIYQQGEQGEFDLVHIRRVTSSPASIDRAVASQIAYPLYLRPQLETAGDTTRILDMIARCTHPSIVDGPRVLYADTTRPHIALKIARETALNTSITDITLPCTLETTTAQGDALTPAPEVDAFNITIPLTRNPLGSIDETITQKLTSIDADIRGIERRIDYWESTNHALTTLRDTSSLIAQTDAALSFVTTAIWALSNVLYKIPQTQSAGSTLWKTNCALYVGEAGSTGIHHLINLAVWYPGHFPGSIILPTPKTASIVQSCQLCSFGGTLRAAIPQTQGDIIVNYDGKRGAPTTLEAVTTYSWEPFKSIHVAQACLCPPGIEYNLRKERQIHCIYRNCIKDAAQLGLPYSHCDATLLEQSCLFVDGAAWKIAGGAATGTIMRDLILDILGATPVMATGTIWTGVCNPIKSALGKQAYSCQAQGGDPFIDWAVPLCGAWSGGLELLETDFFGDNKFAWNTFNGQLEGEDFCIE